jgi:hypothetical protein
LNYKEGESVYSEENSFGRMITVEEVWNLAVFLFGDAGNRIDGGVIHISADRGIFDVK